MYCQIIKQTTENPRQYVVLCAGCLCWLCCPRRRLLLRCHCLIAGRIGLWWLRWLLAWSGRESLVKGWQLLGICSGAFPPSKTFEPYLMWHCHQHKVRWGVVPSGRGGVCGCCVRCVASAAVARAGAAAQSCAFLHVTRLRCVRLFAQDQPGDVGLYATFCLARVKMTGQLGPRREVPTAMEIDACKHRKPVCVDVPCCYNGGQCRVCIRLSRRCDG